MPYIPEQHQVYDLLPWCRKNGGEVFEYHSSSIDRIADLIGGSGDIFPYGFRSYEEYFDSLDRAIVANSHIPDAVKMLKKLRVEMFQLNKKEEWSVLRYIGPSTGKLLGLTKGKVYYWPTTKDKPVYSGVVDDEEFTAYLYPTDADLWEILEDPTGMAYRTIYQRGKGSITKDEHDYIMQQVRAMQTDPEFKEAD